MTREVAEKEMVEGYFDGRDADCPDPGPNRSEAYRHGFQSGRDDNAKKPSAPFAVRWAEAERILGAA